MTIHFSPMLSFLAVSLVGLLPAHWLCASEMPAPPVNGVWQVVQAGVDDADQAHWLYRPNDPRLVNRVLSISATLLAFNDGKHPCEKPRWQAQKTTLGPLIGQNYARPSHPSRSLWPKPANFSLPYSSQLQLTQYRVTCSNDDPKGEWKNFWLATIDAETALLHFDATSLMKIVNKTTHPPVPSYDCKKAELAAEKTICHDHGLAGYDRSIHIAMKAAREKKQTRLRR